MNTNLQLGRTPLAQQTEAQRLKAARVPRLRDLVDVDLLASALPASVDNHAKAAKGIATMQGNDQQGDCVAAWASHFLSIITANDTDSGGIQIPTTKETLAAYHAVGGPGDNGLVITDWFDYLITKGVTLAGKTHKIAGYVSIDPNDLNEHKVAVWLFGAVHYGINLPNAWYQSNRGDTWDITSTFIVGGHMIGSGKYDANGFEICTWAGTNPVTNRAITDPKHFEEAYAVLDLSWTGPDKVAPNGVNLDALQKALADWKNGIVPNVDPVVPPVVPPTPPVGPVTWQGQNSVAIPIKDNNGNVASVSAVLSVGFSVPSAGPSVSQDLLDFNNLGPDALKLIQDINALVKSKNIAGVLTVLADLNKLFTDLGLQTAALTVNGVALPDHVAFAARTM